MLDFRMDTFLAVCETMNFTRAAEKLNITQPAVSQHIRFLEEYYDTRLFQMRGKKTELTRAGKLLQSVGLTMKHDVLSLRKEIRELQEKKSLRFGVTLTVGEFVIPDPLGRYLMLHPDISLKMEVANTQALLKKLDGGEIDFALVEGYFAKNEYEHLVYATEPYIAVCGKRYAFRKDPKRLEELMGERLILREPGSGTREILERCLEERNLSLYDFSNRIEIGSIAAIKELVREAYGVTFLYEAAVKKELREGTLQKIPIEDFSVAHDLTFIWRRGSAFSEQYKKLFRELKADKGLDGLSGR